MEHRSPRHQLGGYFDIFLVGGGGGGAVLGGGGGGGAVTMYRFPGGMKPGSYTVYVGDGANGYVGWQPFWCK